MYTKMIFLSRTKGEYLAMAQVNFLGTQRTCQRTSSVFQVQEKARFQAFRPRSQSS